MYNDAQEKRKEDRPSPVPAEAPVSLKETEVGIESTPLEKSRAGAAADFLKLGISSFRNMIKKLMIHRENTTIQVNDDHRNKYDAREYLKRARDLSKKIKGKR